MDSARDIADSVNIYRRKFGLGPLPAGRIVMCIGKGVGSLLKRTLTSRILASRPDCRREFYRIYLARCARTTRLYPGIRASLHALRRAGVILAVASNKPKTLSEKVLRQLGVRRLFSAVLCGDEVSQPKPHPLSLRILMRRFRASPRATVMVGDSRYDMEAGKRAGCRTCAVSWGYETRKMLARWRPDILVSSGARLAVALLEGSRPARLSRAS